MKNILHSIDILLRKPVFLFLTIIQLSVTLIFVNVALMGKIISDETLERMDSVFKDKKYYKIVDKSNEEVLFSKNLKSLESKEKIVEFYKYIKYNKNFEFIEFYDGFVSAEITHKIDDKFYYSDINDENSNFLKLKKVSVGENFFEEFKFYSKNNNPFSKSDFQKECSENVLLGYEYKNIFKINDKIQYYDYESDKTTECYIKGFLEKNSYFISSDGVINLDYFFIFPMESLPSGENLIAECDFRINQSIIITNNKEETSNEIDEKSNSLNLYTNLNLVDFNNGGEAFANMLEKMINKIFPIIIALFVFTSISIIVSLLGIIRKSYTEFGIHLLSGATIIDISLKIMFVNLMYMGLSFILSTFIFKIIMNSNLIPENEISELNVLIYTIPLIIMITIVISVIPIIKLYTMQINDIIRRKE